MIPLGCFGLFVGVFVGEQIRVVFGVAKLFWERFRFSDGGGTLGFGGLGLQLKDFFSGGSGGGVWLRSGEFFERIDFGALEEALKGLLGRRSRPGAATLATGLRLV